MSFRLRCLKLARRLGATTAQATILLAVASTVLVGFTGLALDGGLAASQHRFVQNAADAAALAGADYLNNNSGATPTQIYNKIVEYGKTKNPARCVGGTCNQTVSARFVRSSGSSYIYGSDVQTAGSVPSDCIGVCVTETLTYSPLFMRILNVPTITVTAKSCAVSTGGTSGCFDGDAIFAYNSACNGYEDDFTSATYVTGNVVTNGDVQNSNLLSITNGTLKYGGTLHNSGTITINPSATPTHLTTTQDWPCGTCYTLSDYAPGGKYALAAGSDYHYFNSTGGFTSYVSNNGGNVTGLFYVDSTSNLNISTAITGTGGTAALVTIVTPGMINVSTGGFNVKAYSDGLLLFSSKTTNCSTNAINISGTGAKWGGVMYAPNGRIQISGGSSTSYNGSIIAQDVHVSGTGTNVSYDSAYCPDSTAGAGLHLVKAPTS